MKFAKERKKVAAGPEGQSYSQYLEDETKKEKRLVKLNWKKIIIIFVIIASIIIGITLGIYYSIAPSADKWPNELDQVSTETVRSEIEKTGENGGTGPDGIPDTYDDYLVVWMMAPDCPYCEFSIYGAPDSETGETDKSNLGGPFSEYTALETMEDSFTTNYRLHTIAVTEYYVGETQKAFNEIFIDESGSKEPEIRYVNGIVGKIEGASLAKENAFKNEGVVASDSNGVPYMTGVAVSPIWVPETTDDNGDTVEAHWAVSTDGTTEWGGVPAWLYFDDAQLKFYVNGIVTEDQTTSEDGSSTTETEKIPSGNFWVQMAKILVEGEGMLPPEPPTSGGGEETPPPA